MHPIVLLHGFPFDGRLWAPCRPGLIRAGFRPWAPDLPGFGRSGPLTTTAPTMDDYAEAVLRAADDNGIDRFALAGHSFGGYVALALAANHPERVTGLGLVASRASADSDAVRVEREATMQRVRDEGPDFLATELVPHLIANDDEGRVHAIVEPIVERLRPAGVIAALGAMATRPDRRDWLAKWDGPLVVVHGEADGVVDVGEAQAMVEAAPGGELVVVPGVGHLPMLEATDATVEALARLG